MLPPVKDVTGSPMYRSLLFVHRWFGITVGLFFVLLGLSGSYLVYKETFQEWIGAEIRRSSGQAGEVDLAAAVAVAQKGLNVDVMPTLLRWSDDPKRNLEFGFSGLPGMGRATVLTFVDPITTEYKGKEIFGETVSGMIFFFHHDIFLGATGRTIMAVSGFAMLFLLVGGLYLWWPRKKTWLQVLSLGRMNNALQVNLELHKFFGFYTLLLMVMVTFSGVYISKPSWFQGSNGERPRGERGSEQAAPPSVDLQKIAELLGAQPRPISARLDPRRSTIQLRVQNRKPKTLSLETFEEVEADQPKPKDMRGVQRDLHGGYFWGEIGRALVFASGLLPLFFYISGFYIWWKKSKIRRRKQTKKVVYG